MTRKRSSYRPKGVNPIAHLMAMMGAAALSRDDVLRRAMRLRLAVDEACIGRATPDDWRQVFDAVNMAEQLIRMKLCAGREVVEGLQETIEAIHDRQRTTGTKALHQAERAMLQSFAVDYADILGGVTQQQYMLAQRGVEDRIRRILSGERIPASVRVVEAVE